MMLSLSDREKMMLVLLREEIKSLAFEAEQDQRKVVEQLQVKDLIDALILSEGIPLVMGSLSLHMRLKKSLIRMSAFRNKECVHMVRYLVHIRMLHVIR